MPTGTGLPLCHEYICRGGSCQEHRGIIFLMAIPVALCLRNSGSQTPDCWLKLDRNTQYLPYKMQKALDLIPLVGSSTDIFRTNTFRILGKLIWSPYLLITIPVLIGILCMPFAIKSWSRRMKA